MGKNNNYNPKDIKSFLLLKERKKKIEKRIASIRESILAEARTKKANKHGKIVFRHGNYIVTVSTVESTTIKSNAIDTIRNNQRLSKHLSGAIEEVEILNSDLLIEDIEEAIDKGRLKKKDVKGLFQTTKTKRVT